MKKATKNRRTDKHTLVGIEFSVFSTFFSFGSEYVYICGVQIDWRGARAGVDKNTKCAHTVCATTKHMLRAKVCHFAIVKLVAIKKNVYLMRNEE